MANKVQAVSVDKESLMAGAPSGNLSFVAIPEPTFTALSDVAAKRGMTVAQAISKALHDFCEKHGG
jgi:hypothetical protein